MCVCLCACVCVCVCLCVCVVGVGVQWPHVNNGFVCVKCCAALKTCVLKAAVFKLSQSRRECLSDGDDGC